MLKSHTKGVAGNQVFDEKNMNSDMVYADAWSCNLAEPSRNIREVSRLRELFVDLLPGVLQLDCPVEDQPSGPAVVICTEIAHSLELEFVERFNICQ